MKADPGFQQRLGCNTSVHKHDSCKKQSVPTRLESCLLGWISGFNKQKNEIMKTLLAIAMTDNLKSEIIHRFYVAYIN